MNPADTVIPGVIVLSGGLLLIAAGLLLWRDTGGILTKWYGQVIRSCRRIPFLGEIWIEQTPFSAFRTRTLIYVVMGVMFSAIGIFLLVRSP